MIEDENRIAGEYTFRDVDEIGMIANRKLLEQYGERFPGTETSPFLSVSQIVAVLEAAREHKMNPIEELYERWEQLKADLAAAGLEQIATVGVDGGSFVIGDSVSLAVAVESEVEDDYYGASGVPDATRVARAINGQAKANGLLFSWGDGDYPVYAIRGEDGIDAILIVNGP